MVQFEGWELGGVLLIPFVVQFVQIVKRFSGWMRVGERAFGLCLVMGTALGLLYQVLVNLPTTPQGWILAVLSSIAFAFAAGEAYDRAKRNEALRRYLDRLQGKKR